TNLPGYPAAWPAGGKSSRHRRTKISSAMIFFARSNSLLGMRVAFSNSSTPRLATLRHHAMWGLSAIFCHQASLCIVRNSLRMGPGFRRDAVISVGHFWLRVDVEFAVSVGDVDNT